MSHSQGSEHDYERLSKAITEAVMHSEKVKKVVSEIQKRDKICPESFMVLVLKMQMLTETFEIEIDEDFSEKKAAKRTCKKKSSPEAQYIDGRKLTKSEIAFQEFSRKRFDTQSWLKKNGLIL